jgi:hypothetical protein
MFPNFFREDQKEAKERAREKEAPREARAREVRRDPTTADDSK